MMDISSHLFCDLESKSFLEKVKEREVNSSSVYNTKTFIINKPIIVFWLDLFKKEEYDNKTLKVPIKTYVKRKGEGMLGILK